MIRADQRVIWLLLGWLAAAAAGVGLSGCISAGASAPTPAAAEGTAISFESIDGPPRPLASRLARSLDQEAAARRLVVVPRGGEAQYHVRGYFASHSDNGQTAIAWAFDVYDTSRRRAFRVRGEERTGAGAAWALDDTALARIAARSIADLMAQIAVERTGASADRAHSVAPS